MQVLGAQLMNTLRIGVVMGTTHTAREASIRTGRAIAAGLEQAGHSVTPIEIEHPREAFDQLRKHPIDVALLALEGRLGEEGCIQGVLELLQIPYSGSGVLESALAMDKVKTKELFRLHNVPTPAYYVFSGAPKSERLLETHGSFGFPAVVKPRRAGGSRGVGIVSDFESFEDAVKIALCHDDDVLVERFVKGQELTVAILNGRVLGSLEVTPAQGLYDSFSKQNPALAEYHLPARLSPALQNNVLCLAERAADAVGARGAVRVDLLVTENQNEYVLEVNTMPSLAEGGTFMRIAEAAGFGQLDVCEALIAHAALGAKYPTVSKKATVVPLVKTDDSRLRAVAG
jgi:D-alanine-D-alanine ligase